MDWDLSKIFQYPEPPSTEPEISNDGEICLWNGEVLVRRFLHCTHCKSIFNITNYVNLSRQEEGIERLRNEMNIPLCPCGEESLAFISLDEILLAQNQGDY